MERVNIFSAENLGRIDVSRAVGSEATAMYVYDRKPGRSWSAATSSVSRPVLPERTRS
jgi:hypothetical protein